MRFAAMQAPADRPGLDQASLARAIASDRATIGGVLRRFGRTGIVLRRPAPDDRRAIRWELAPEGHA